MTKTAAGASPVDCHVMPPAKPCDCIEQMNAKLMERGYTLHIGDVVRWGADGQPKEEVGTAPLLKTDKFDRKARGPAPSVYGPFCMFCGQRRWPAA